MALFTDGIIATVDELAGHDSAVLRVASTEGIDLTKKLSLAMEELALELGNLLPASERLDRVAVTPAVRMWHAFRTLELVYRDAYSNQLNDRYAWKRDQFAELAKRAFDKLMDSGVGMVSDPVAKAKAPELTFFAGAPEGATYYVCTSWENAQREEGAAGDWIAISVPDSNVLSVRATTPPSNASGWNVFVGLSPDSIVQQNEAAILPNQAWLQESDVSTTGRTPGSGQTADYVRRVARILQRG
jgi:hypothetical protein